jgi:hypothetical protein
MKKILIAASVVAGVAAYFLVKQSKRIAGHEGPGYKPRSRHFTKLFSRAKATM